LVATCAPVRAGASGRTADVLGDAAGEDTQILRRDRANCRQRLADRVSRGPSRRSGRFCPRLRSASPARSTTPTGSAGSAMVRCARHSTVPPIAK
jgi:hypothetical protein